jgi:hypothetical protein
MTGATRAVPRGAWLAVALVATACEGAEARLGPPRTFLLADALEVRVPLAATAHVETDGGRVLVLDDGLVLRAQAVSSAGGAERRTAGEVATALAARYALGEQSGTLRERPCRFAGDEYAACVDGSFDRGGRRWTRRGAVLVRGEWSVWLDVAGPEDRAESVEAWARVLGEQMALGGVEGG